MWLIMASMLVPIVGAPSPSWEPLRCSVRTLRDNPEGYHYPLEHVRRFVEEAEVIVRAVTIGLDSTGSAGRNAHGVNSVVVFRLVEILRGSLADGQLVLPGVLVDRDDFNPGPVPYRIVRRSGQRGDCFAKEYRAEAEYLLLLRDSPAGLTPYWAPLAPLNEQIRGSKDPWLGWVRAEIGGQSAVSWNDGDRVALERRLGRAGSESNGG